MAALPAERPLIRRMYDMFHDDRHLLDNDIDVLRQRLGLPGLTYVDLSAQRELEQVLQRWPLLAELAVSERRVAATPAEPELA